MNKESLINRAKKQLEERKYSSKTNRLYIDWIEKYLDFFETDKEHKTFDDESIQRFLEELKVKRRYSQSTLSQAYNAVMFFYKTVLRIDLSGETNDFKPSREQRKPNTLSKEEVSDLLKAIRGEKQVIVKLIYGCGLRLNEVLNLCIKDIDMRNNKIFVNSPAAGRSRSVSLPLSLKDQLEEQIGYTELLFKKDSRDFLQKQFEHITFRNQITGEMKQPDSINDYFLFTSKTHFYDKETKSRVRDHVNTSTIPRILKKARDLCGIKKPVTTGSLRNSYILFLIENGYDFNMLQDVLGYSGEQNFTKFKKLLKPKKEKVINPLDL